MKLNGAATLVKTGSATLKVNDFASFAGMIDVREGTLETGAALPVEPALKDEGRLVHFDATYGVQTVTNADLSITVTNWLDRTGNRNAEPRGSASVAFMPWGMKGNPAIDMPPGVSLWWKKDGAYASLDNIGTVFWIIGSQNGGGFVLGGGTQVDTGNGKEDFYPWHRGLDHQGQGAGYHGDPIYSGSGSYIVGDGTIRLNGEVIDKGTTGLSGAWDQMTWIATTNSSGVTRLAPAAGFAFDGREYRYGCQRLAEVIIYNHRLTDAEVAGVEAYLNAKWGFAESARTGAGTIVLAAGATLKTNGDQYVNKLGGSGAVSGDVTVKNFVADTTAAGLTVDGVLTIAANPTVELKNLPQVGLDTLRITVVAAASSFAGTDNLADAVFTGETFSEGFKAKLAVADGKLVVTFVRAGMTLFIR